jgi:phospholipid/cholesterol/gamma-HCH transport system permease protein
MTFLYYLGQYFLFLNKVFSKPEKFRVYYQQTILEILKLGVSSIYIVAIISVFIGAVITIQGALNATLPMFPKYLIGYGVRDSLILEFSSSVIALILAGKVGSNISSEIGAMRVTEQIDALEIMGVNSTSFLVLPKIIATMLFNPILTIISIVVGIIGGWAAGILTGVITSSEFIYGIQRNFNPFYVTYSIVKTIVFAFIITSIAAYQGYNVSGGSLEVGKASTKAVVYSSIVILFFNLILTQLMLM